MAVPSVDQRYITEWTGCYTPAEHDSLYSELSDGRLVALSVLRTRRAIFLNGPAKAGVDNDYSEDYTETLRQMDDVISQLHLVIEAAGLETDSSRFMVASSEVTLGGVRFR